MPGADLEGCRRRYHQAKRVSARPPTTAKAVKAAAPGAEVASDSTLPAGADIGVTMGSISLAVTNLGDTTGPTSPEGSALGLTMTSTSPGDTDVGDAMGSTGLAGNVMSRIQVNSGETRV